MSFDEACTVFADPKILSLYDEGHSEQEERWISMGLSVLQRVLVVVHVWIEEDEDGDEVIRLISARRANAKERRTYLEGER